MRPFAVHILVLIPLLQVSISWAIFPRNPSLEKSITQSRSGPRVYPSSEQEDQPVAVNPVNERGSLGPAVSLDNTVSRRRLKRSVSVRKSARDTTATATDVQGDSFINTGNIEGNDSSTSINTGNGGDIVNNNQEVESGTLVDGDVNGDTTNNNGGASNNSEIQPDEPAESDEDDADDGDENPAADFIDKESLRPLDSGRLGELVNSFNITMTGEDNVDRQYLCMYTGS